MKNIVFIQYTLGGGGAEKVLINLLDNIDYTKYNVTLALVYKKGIYLEQINKNVKLKCFYNPEKFKLRLLQSMYYRLTMFLYNKFPKLLYRFVIGDTSDVEIAFLEGETTRLLQYSKNKKSKKIAWIHTDLRKVNLLPSQIERQCYKEVNQVICVSNGAKESFCDLYPEYKDKTKVIYNLIDTKKIRELSNDKIDLNYKEHIILGIGRLIKLKRFDLLIEAHKLMLDEGIDNKLIIIGEGDERPKLEKLIAHLHVEDSVRLIGFTENPYPYIKQADIFALTSDFEGLPLVICEALVLGKAIVATRCTGPVELLGNGKYGMLINNDDLDALKNALKDIVTNESLKIDLQNRAQERSKIFSIDNSMDEIYSILE